MRSNIHLLTHPKFLGDKNQALGIKSALLKHDGAEKIIATEWDDSNVEQLRSLQEMLNEAKEQNILIAIGDHGLTAIQQLALVARTKVLIVYACHQYLPQLKNLRDRINIVALPTHIITPQIRADLRSPNLKIVETIGVAHNVNSQELVTAFNKWQEDAKKAIVTKAQYIGVILGGDAPEPSGKMRFFTAKQGKQMAKFLASLSKENEGAHLLITNSPRTGKYDPLTSQELKVHTGQAIDLTSAALLTELDKQQIPYQFFDFVAGQDSAYKPILGALQKTEKSIAVVTGESTSMVTEISDSLPKQPLYVVNIASMNDSHYQHIQSVHSTGSATVVDLTADSFKIIPAKKQTPSQHQTAAESIAGAVISWLQPKSSKFSFGRAIIAGLALFGVGMVIKTIAAASETQSPRLDL